MQIIQNRRTFLAGLTAVGGAGLIGTSTPAWAEAPPETTTVRLPRYNGGAYCWAANYLAGELLRAEGFTDVRYVQGDTSVDNSVWLARGNVDFGLSMPSMNVASIDAGAAIRVLTGVHTGCFELIANDSVLSMTDLRGKRVGVSAVGFHPYVLTSLMANYVGLDPVRDIQWVESGQTTPPMQLFLDGKVDAFLAVTPEPQVLRNHKIGCHTIISIAVDRPWSQYFCCMVAGSADYVNRYPVATKHVLRAILKATDFCASNPTLAAQQLVDRGFLPRYDYALGTLKETQHDVWREYDAEDTLRFYALRMQETGMIRSSPQEIIAKGTDWRFLDELKRELKA